MEFDQNMDTERRIIRKAGFKVTLPRQQVLRALRNAETEGEHLSAENLYHRINQGDGHISMAAIYRILAQFENANMVTRHQFFAGSNRSVYQLASGRNHHNHMVCEISGDIIEFDNSKLEKLEKDIARAHGYEIVNSQVVLYVRKLEAR